ncbi:MAG: Ig-like domain-containing protein, partial [Patescibacteria group bacterium]
TLDGVEVPHNTIRKFYSQREATSASLCQTYSIDRKCESGVLSGASEYRYASCTPQTGGTGARLDASASVSGQTVTLSVQPIEISYCSNTQADNASIDWGDGSVTANTVVGWLWGNSCTNGNPLAPSHTYAVAGTHTIVITLNGYTKTLTVTTSSAGQPSITITAPTNGQTFTTNSNVPISWTSHNAPAGSFVKVSLGGSIQLADYQSPSGTFNWTPTLTGQSYLKAILYGVGTIYAQSPFVNVTVTAGTVASVGSCIYRGENFPEGTVKTIQVYPHRGGTDPYAHTMSCDNSAWMEGEIQVCSRTLYPQGTGTLGNADFGCTPWPYNGNYAGWRLTIPSPRHGNSPLTVTAKANITAISTGYICAAYTLDCGDGTINSAAQTSPSVNCPDANNQPKTFTHTYTTVGPHTIRFTVTPSSDTVSDSVNIRVDP